jgi:hypothetical protein
MPVHPLNIQWLKDPFVSKLTPTGFVYAEDSKQLLGTHCGSELAREEAGTSAKYPVVKDPFVSKVERHPGHSHRVGGSCAMV